jgi:hypothetical protein
MEQQAYQYFARIEEQGGVLACIDNGFFVRLCGLLMPIRSSRIGIRTALLA